MTIGMSRQMLQNPLGAPSRRQIKAAVPYVHHETL